jgi:hypothetical protein
MSKAFSMSPLVPNVVPWTYMSSFLDFKLLWNVFTMAFCFLHQNWNSLGKNSRNSLARSSGILLEELLCSMIQKLDMFIRHCWHHTKMCAKPIKYVCKKRFWFLAGACTILYIHSNLQVTTGIILSKSRGSAYYI